MKKQIFILTMVALMCSTSGFAQGYIKVNPISLAIGIINVGYEQVTGPKQSLQVKAYSHFSTGVLGGRVLYKFFLSNKDSPAGLYVAPIASYNLVEGEDAFARVGGIIGYQAILSNDRLLFEGGIGPAYTLGTEIGLLPIFSLNLGIRIGKGRKARSK